MVTEFHTKKSKLKLAFLVMALLASSVVRVEACPKDKPWKRVSRPEKIWSVTHPFKAKKVFRCALRARFVTDSLEKAGVLTDPNGGQLDAFRHAYWMALLINEGLREKTVRKIGVRHEKGNYIDFKKGKLEDSMRSDSMMSVMDLRNNNSGIAIGKEYLSGDKKLSLIELIIKEIWNGKLVIMLKDEKGLYLDQFNKVIDISEYSGKWYIPKYIVNSDMIDIEH